jgi:hypothetical protein
VFILRGLGCVFADVFILGELAGILGAKTGRRRRDFVDVLLPKALRGGKGACGKVEMRRQRSRGAEKWRRRGVVAAVTFTFTTKATRGQHIFTMWYSNGERAAT